MSQKYKVYINNKPKIIIDNWKVFCSSYTLIEAAGGIVYNNEGKLLMIFRNGKWDLPKGKIEKGEDIRACAIREVEEECGISGLEIISSLEQTYHTYMQDGKEILKRTYWFKMCCDFKGKLTPQKEEGIMEAVWFDKDDVEKKIQNTFENIKQLLIDELH